MKIPFTNYDIHVSKRGVNVLDNGRLVSFVDWSRGFVQSANTPILEEIYNAVASEFAKIDLFHIIDRETANGVEYKHLTDNLNFVISERPNELQSSFEFKWTIAYQLFKYGNAVVFIHRDKKGIPIKLEPINAPDFEFGCGYQVADDLVFLKYRDKKTGEQILADYRNIIHLRLNPNNIFTGDLFNTDSSRVMVDVIDASLHSLLNELKDSGTIRGVIKIGESNIGYANGFANRALADNEAKIDKQKEILNRIRATKGGILVLDAGESWQSLDNPFDTTSTRDIDKYIDMLLQFNGINKKVVDGTADADQMEVFFNKVIAPRIEQFVSELNYKCFTRTARSQGHKIQFRRDVFEYIPITKAIDVIYKGVQDTTTNERRRMIYKLPPIENGDVVMANKNFTPLEELLKEEQSNERESV